MTVGPPRDPAVLDLAYAEGRERKRAWRYRLRRRSREVLAAVGQYAGADVGDIVDLGTADGGMLEAIRERYPRARCVGVEYSGELAACARARLLGAQIVQGDIQDLPFAELSFDVAVAAAVIEHVADPARVMGEVKRLLRPGGILVLTSPDPFWERLATMVGHLGAGQHHRVMNLGELSGLASRAGLTVLKTGKFMLSPVGMPFETGAEKIVRALRLDCLMANQLLVARS